MINDSRPITMPRWLCDEESSETAVFMARNMSHGLNQEEKSTKRHK
jgi:hypothetical protein